MAYNAGFPANGVDNQGWKLYITSLIMVISAGLVVLWRLVLRVAKKTLGPDDFTIVASLVRQLLSSPFVSADLARLSRSCCPSVSTLL